MNSNNQVRNMKEGSFDPKNEKHFYVGRYRKYQKKGQPNLGNPFHVGRDGSRTECLQAYRQWLWREINTNLVVREHLRKLPDDAILFCHCKPFSCHGEIILKASQWLKKEWPEEVEEGHPTPAGEWKLAFGKYKGLTLREVFEENPGYLDWLGSQTYIYGATRKAVHSYLDQPYVKEEIERRFWAEEKIFHTDDRNEYRPPRDYCFIPSLQKSKRFALGKPNFIRIKYGPRPKPEATDEFRYGEQFLTPMEAWELAADILRACEEVPKRRSHIPEQEWDEDYLREHIFPKIANWEKRNQLKRMLSQEAYEKIQTAFQEAELGAALSI